MQFNGCFYSFLVIIIARNEESKIHPINEYALCYPTPEMLCKCRNWYHRLTKKTHFFSSASYSVLPVQRSRLS